MAIAIQKEPQRAQSNEEDAEDEHADADEEEVAVHFGDGLPRLLVRV
jgi:hypothetical protein